MKVSLNLCAQLRVLPTYLSVLFLLLFGSNVQSHGLKSASATISVRPNHLIELQVQFDFIQLLNHKNKNYSLGVIAALSDEDFGRLYDEVIKLFDRALLLEGEGHLLSLNRRYPSQSQMFGLLKRQFIESKLSGKQKAAPYTFSDRRFYQVFFFDFKMRPSQSLKDLEVTFPEELGDVYVTVTRSRNREVHAGEVWRGR
jgi:hypothetical protein